jgi:hypothetical protein
MTKHLLALAFGGALLLAGSTARAHDAYDDSQSHPLRLLAYAVNPAGYAVEWLALRPLHFVVSHPQLERVFGHGPHEHPFGGYEPYEPEHR